MNSENTHARALKLSIFSFFHVFLRFFEILALNEPFPDKLEAFSWPVHATSHNYLYSLESTTAKASYFLHVFFISFGG